MRSFARYLCTADVLDGVRRPRVLCVLHTVEVYRHGVGVIGHILQDGPKTDGPEDLRLLGLLSH